MDNSHLSRRLVEYVQELFKFEREEWKDYQVSLYHLLNFIFVYKFPLKIYPIQSEGILDELKKYYTQIEFVKQHRQEESRESLPSVPVGTRICLEISWPDRFPEYILKFVLELN